MRYLSSLATLALLVLAGGAHAAGPPEFSLTIKNHQFQPSELVVPANTRIRLRIANQDATPEEFESTDFSRESLVLPGKTTVVFIGPLSTGSYHFFGDFHRSTARGQLTVN